MFSKNNHLKRLTLQEAAIVLAYEDLQRLQDNFDQAEILTIDDCERLLACIVSIVSYPKNINRSMIDDIARIINNTVEDSIPESVKDSFALIKAMARNHLKIEIVSDLQILIGHQYRFKKRYYPYVPAIVMYRNVTVVDKTKRTVHYNCPIDGDRVRKCPLEVFRKLAEKIS